jgi:Xaa-Pro aminopeptidase
MKLDQIQAQLKEQKLDGWLLFDHHYRDALAYRVLGLPSGLHVTRRWYYLIPADGAPKKLTHRIESKLLDSLEGTKHVYSSWAEQTNGLASLLVGCKEVAMQYSPNCAIPYISNVDGGTIDLVRSNGVEVVSSAELIQFFEARLDEKALESHLEAGVKVDAVRAAAFEWIGDAIRSGHEVNEWQAAEFIRQRFASVGLITDNGPIVAVDGHGGDPHYEPTFEGSARIQSGSFVLLDMWAKLDQPGSIFYDITWTGYCGETVPDKIARVFNIVKDARKAAARKVINAFEQKLVIRGFEVDDACREVINAAGFGPQFVHRTGHSIGVDVHANGANMDNLETHDDRVIIPWSCFSIEPGIYLEEFGVRSEVDIFVDDSSARVTGEEQDAIVLIG